jgi:hypothetical protein
MPDTESYFSNREAAPPPTGRNSIPISSKPRGIYFWQAQANLIFGKHFSISPLGIAFPSFFQRMIFKMGFFVEKAYINRREAYNSLLKGGL